MADCYFFPETQRQIGPGEFAMRMKSIRDARDLDGDSMRLLAKNLLDETLKSIGYGEGLAILDMIRKVP